MSSAKWQPFCADLNVSTSVNHRLHDFLFMIFIIYTYIMITEYLTKN